MHVLGISSFAGSNREQNGSRVSYSKPFGPSLVPLPGAPGAILIRCLSGFCIQDVRFTTPHCIDYSFSCGSLRKYWEAAHETISRNLSRRSCSCRRHIRQCLHSIGRSVCNRCNRERASIIVSTSVARRRQVLMKVESAQKEPHYCSERKSAHTTYIRVTIEKED